MKADHKGIYHKYFIYEGKRQKVSAKSADECMKKYYLKLKALEEGNIIVNKNTTVSKWALEWLETYKKGSVGTATYKNCLGNINNHILPSIGGLKIKDVKQVQLQKILNNLQGYSKDHISRINYTLYQIFEKACDNSLIFKNPAKGLQIPKSEDGTHRSITAEERKYILELAEKHPAGLFIKLMLHCGLRPGETAVLTWDNVDIKNKKLMIMAARESRTNGIKDPKSKAGFRSVPIPDVFLRNLKNVRGLPNTYVLINPNTGFRFTESAMNRMWNNFKRELDIMMGAEVYRNEIIKTIVADDLVPYCLRHTYCTDLQAAGVPINVAKELMGHKNIAVTANIYTHHSEDAFDSAAKAINRLQHRLQHQDKNKPKNVENKVL